MEESSFYGAFGSGGSSGGGGGSTEATIVYINGKKDSAGTIAKGLPVYLVGYDSDIHTVELANANSGSTMPVIGFTNEPFNNTDSKKIITFGKLEGVDTTSTVSTLNPNGETWAVNDALYMNSTAGGLTKVRPTGTNFIQRIAKVLRVDASGGQIFIFNTARTAGLPNLTTDNVWVGDANGYPQMVNKSTLGGNTIYTANDALTGDRILDLGGYGLTFQKSATPTQYTKIYRNGGLELRGAGFDTANDVFTIKARTSGTDVLKVGHNGGFTLDSSINMGQFNATWNYGQRFTDGYISFLNGANWNDNEHIRFDLRNNTSPELTFLRLASSSAGNRFIVRGTALIETNYGTSKEQISLQGNTLIKGDTGAERTPYNFKIVNSSSNTTFVVNNNQSSEFYGIDTLSTSTVLAIYDGDATPNKLWDFVNSGDVNLGQAVDINTSNTFNFVNGSREVGIASWNTHAYWGINNGTRRWDLISANASSIFNVDEFGIANGSIVPIRIYNGSSVALGNVVKSNLNTAYSVQTNGDTLIGGNLDATDGTNIIELDFNNYPKVKLATPTQEWWLIEGDGTGATFNNGDLYIYDSTGATKLVQFKQSGGGILLGGTLDMDNNRITNAVINPSVQETTSTATFTINADQETDGVLTAMATNTTIASPTGTPVQSQSLIFRFKDDGTSRTLTWNAIFRAIGVTLPTATTANKLLYVGCKYNSTDTKWDVVSVQEEA